MSSAGTEADVAALELAANDLPLDPGVHLIEASAGTGKTFTLAHLVLRLVGERELSLRALLVVTFTKAAAAELRDRIGRRLQQAQQLLQTSDPAGHEGLDQELKEWLGSIPPPHRERLRAQLLLALEELDAADITTIHGFCHRSLQRQALEAALAPEVELENDGSLLQEQVVHDYWQQQVLPLPAHALRGLIRKGVQIEALQSLLAKLDGDPTLASPELPPGWDPERPLAGQWLAQWEADWQRFQALWDRQGEALEQAVCAAAAARRQAGLSSKGPYSAKPRHKRTQLLAAWLEDQPCPGSYAELLEEKTSWIPDYFHPGPISQAAALDGPQATLPQPRLLEAAAALVDGPAEAVLSHFCHWARAELALRRQRGGRMSYGDLLVGLDPGGDGGRRPGLIEALSQRYEAVLIDEFQDTDPLQWRILHRAFATTGAQPRHLLVLVGDPKQAIYRFRGGDLDTYRTAGRTAAARHRLARNFRSSAPLLDALNELMAPGLPRSELPVKPLRAARRDEDESLILPAGQQPLQLLWLGSDRAAGEAPPGRGELEKRASDRVAALVLDLLRRGWRMGAGEGTRALQPSDLCLLVDRHQQAEDLRQALERRGLPSRLISQGDVFAGEGAALLQRLLDALAEPGSGPRLRLLAASPLLGWSPQQLAAAGSQEWDRLSSQLARLAERLPDDGLLATLGRLLRSEELARLSLQGRWLADLQQCAELVQERLHQQRLGAAASADWLRRRRLHPPETVPENQQPHSDAVSSAVGVVTVHRSKGLEFPVVICPYFWQGVGSANRRGSRGLGRRWTPQHAGGPQLDVHLDQRWGPGQQAAEQEQAALAAERERLAYVALTRARDLLVLGFGPALGQASNPLMPWLFSDLPLQPLEPDTDLYTDRSDQQWLEHLEGEIQRSALPITLISGDPEQPASARWHAPAEAGDLRTGPVPRWSLLTGWGRSSYSSWTQGAHGGPLAPEAIEEGRETDGFERTASDEGDPGSRAADPVSPEWGPEIGEARNGPLAMFPRGAAAGDCLHRILERVDHRLPGDEPIHRELVDRELERAGLDLEHAPATLQFLERLRRTPMGGALGEVCLAQLDPGRQLREMPFDLPLATDADASAGRALVRARGLAEVFSRHPEGTFTTAYAERLAELTVASRGFLTGSIDLVFTAPGADGQERWWVADWKSNWLGQRDLQGLPVACGPLDYGRAGMAAVMESHHYPLQAHLYLVALHRYLGWRLPGYNPLRDLGGFVYIFLRGVPGAISPPPGLTMAELSVPGMFVEPAPLGRLEALDALLREGQR
ncbi:UvrD-helicase domain-containing protein [Synechococcus sp. BA-124 BA4]|uniref:UvrD-helicase domain-containing protein n=1 Tax=unclassified Synechococcus TaxID=2626047 RepID=UPI002AD224C9|nr:MULTISPECIES: UvrD-helicase domain-containing protein [unclassified Synechococcus]MEA5400316.1 UvrD-helicase domain-containing protein [Synechococcus sp. BA-124 BA4]CAK6694849.1 RecBCD enzyme subunit RecB [Synechococcus sp. CBW1107]